MERKKTIVIEAVYNRNNLPKEFFELRKEAHERIIEYKQKTGCYQKSSYSFPNNITSFSEPVTNNLLSKNKKYLEILKIIPL